MGESAREIETLVETSIAVVITPIANLVSRYLTLVFAAVSRGTVQIVPSRFALRRVAYAVRTRRERVGKHTLVAASTAVCRIVLSIKPVVHNSIAVVVTAVAHLCA
jgi:hypothetical protein